LKRNYAHSERTFRKAQEKYRQQHRIPANTIPLEQKAQLVKKWSTDGGKLSTWVSQNAPRIRKRAFKNWVKAINAPAKPAPVRKKLSWIAKWKLVHDWETKSRENKDLTREAWCKINNIAPKSLRNWTSKSERDRIQTRAFYPKHSRRRIRRGKYDDAEKKLNDYVVERRAEGEFMSVERIKAKMMEIMTTLHPTVVEEKTKSGRKKFSASNRWLLGYRSRRRIVYGWATRFGWSLRIPTKKKSFDLNELVSKVKRFHYWAVYLMALPGPAEQPRDPLYGKYPGTARFHLDQVPIGFSRLFQRTMSEKGSKVVYVRIAHKEMEKRFAALVYVARAQGPQPPPIIVLPGKPFVQKNADKSIKRIDTRVPASTIVRNEQSKYTKGVWVYYDPKFRTSQHVLKDILTDLKKWLREQGEADDVVMGLDNLKEHNSEIFKQQAGSGRPRIKLAFTPTNTTDLCSVTDYDLGRMDKSNIRKAFLLDFHKTRINGARVPRMEALLSQISGLN